MDLWDALAFVLFVRCVVRQARGTFSSHGLEKAESQ
jgi:hypothetical protein